MTTKTAIRVDLIFRACSDRTRLRILNMLRGGELCVCHLVDVLALPQPTVSRHLAYLRRAKLVVFRKDGLWAYYSLATPRTRFHQALLDCLERADVPEYEADSRRVATMQKCC